MIRVQTWNEFVSPKFYGPLAMGPWLRISPQSSLNVIYLLITAQQWLMSYPYIPMQIKPIKAWQGKGQHALPLREWLCCPFSSTGLRCLCEFVSSQLQCHGYCLQMTASISTVLYNQNFWPLIFLWDIFFFFSSVYPAWTPRFHYKLSSYSF